MTTLIDPSRQCRGVVMEGGGMCPACTSGCGRFNVLASEPLEPILGLEFVPATGTSRLKCYDRTPLAQRKG